MMAKQRSDVIEQSVRWGSHSTARAALAKSIAVSAGVVEDAVEQPADSSVTYHPDALKRRQDYEVRYVTELSDPTIPVISC